MALAMTIAHLNSNLNPDLTRVIFGMVKDIEDAENTPLSYEDVEKVAPKRVDETVELLRSMGLVMTNRRSDKNFDLDELVNATRGTLMGAVFADMKDNKILRIERLANLNSRRLVNKYLVDYKDYTTEVWTISKGFPTYIDKIKKSNTRVSTGVLRKKTLQEYQITRVVWQGLYAERA